MTALLLLGANVRTRFLPRRGGRGSEIGATKQLQDWRIPFGWRSEADFIFAVAFCQRQEFTCTQQVHQRQEFGMLFGDVFPQVLVPGAWRRFFSVESSHVQSKCLEFRMFFGAVFLPSAC